MTEPNLNYQNRGGTYAEGRSGLAKHGTTDNHLLTAAANVLVFDGVQTTLALDTDITPNALPLQADLTTCLYLHVSTAGGTVSQIKGTEVLTADLTAGKAQLEWPRPTADTIPVGGYKVVTSGATFTNGTTDYDATGVTTTFASLAGRVPMSPL